MSRTELAGSRRTSPADGSPHGHLRGLCIALLLSLFAFTSPLAQADEDGDSLRDIIDLARAGAPQLALHLLEKRRPDPQADLNGWMHWLRLHAKLLKEQRAWQRLVALDIPATLDVPDDFHHWLTTRRAEALLALGEGVNARNLLAQAIWSGAHTSRQLPMWRRLVMESYLREGDNEAASLAMLRYHYDYGTDRETILLRARILLALGRAQEAHTELQPFTDLAETGPLRLLAELRGNRSWRDVYNAAQEALQKSGLTPELRLHYHALAAEAALIGREPSLLVEQLESLFSVAESAQLPDGLYHHDIDMLWRAYVEYAQALGNQEHLLQGDDAAWFASADAVEQAYPVRMRSFLALLSLRGATEEGRQRAQQRLAEAIKTLDGGSLLMQRLFLDSSHFREYALITPLLRYQLAEEAIIHRNLAAASELLSGLDTPPQDMESHLWQLRRARIFSLVGENGKAAAVAAALIEDARQMEREQIDRLIQLLFDLQEVGDHEHAYTLLQALFERIDEPQLKRELLYWMGDSRNAQGRYAEAAKLYLQSASWRRADTLDPWAQTARYQAAQMMTEAGLFADARAQYLLLLEATRDTVRRALLTRDLEQVRLVESKNQGKSE